MNDARTNGTDARDEAFESSKRFSSEVKTRVFCALVKRGKLGATDHELCAELQMIKDTVAPARNALMNMRPPLVVNSGEKRLTPSGRRATVWWAVDSRLRELQQRVIKRVKGGFQCYTIDEHNSTDGLRQYVIAGLAIDRAHADAWLRTGDMANLTTQVLFRSWRNR